MAKLLCECSVKILQWLFLINVISSKILQENKLDYVVMKVNPSKKSLRCCQTSSEYLQCLQALFAHIYDRRNKYFKVPKKTLKECLDIIFNDGDKLKHDITRKIISYIYSV